MLKSRERLLLLDHCSTVVHNHNDTYSPTRSCEYMHGFDTKSS